MDLGRPPTARFPGRDERLADSPVTQEDLDYAVTQVSEGHHFWGVGVGVGRGGEDGYSTSGCIGTH